jgi:hypothetical protein
MEVELMAKRNYSTTDREMAAIMWAVKMFRPYILGRHFKIVTDHKPLKWVFNVKALVHGC